MPDESEQKQNLYARKRMGWPESQPFSLGPNTMFADRIQTVGIRGLAAHVAVKKNLVPAGFVEAFRIKHRYDPVKTCRGKDIRVRVMLLGLLIGIACACSTFVFTHYNLQSRATIENIGLAGFILITLNSVFLFLIQTGSLSHRARIFCSAYNDFANFFGAQYKSKTPDDLRTPEAIDSLIRRVGASIALDTLNREATNTSAEFLREKLQTMNDIASEIGLSHPESVYFTAASSQTDLYQFFVWEI